MCCHTSCLHVRLMMKLIIGVIWSLTLVQSCSAHDNGNMLSFFLAPFENHWRVTQDTMFFVGWWVRLKTASCLRYDMFTNSLSSSPSLFFCIIIIIIITFSNWQSQVPHRRQKHSHWFYFPFPSFPLPISMIQSSVWTYPLLIMWLGLLRHKQRDK